MGVVCCLALLITATIIIWRTARKALAVLPHQVRSTVAWPPATRFGEQCFASTIILGHTSIGNHCTAQFKPRESDRSSLSLGIPEWFWATHRCPRTPGRHAWLHIDMAIQRSLLLKSSHGSHVNSHCDELRGITSKGSWHMRFGVDRMRYP
ncbi:hypothetical protein B0T22DRAFT_461874 [Podospora appendiculata]|uniref:Uncharacterized protein n=1 Tax=Podospora appendiculata TaxID=314037 RepID=A0AAE0XBH7_9PEZI|nr:hypothetical protein B0T22DRAFT_461874 [Podospora appendiculata]